MRSLAGTLDVMRPHLPPALVTPHAFLRASEAIAHLDAAVTTGLYFECRLHDRSPRVDLVIAVHPPGAALLAAGAGAVDPPGGGGVGGELRLRDFCRAWIAPASPLRGRVDHLWLEYDIEDDPHLAGRTGAGPGVFFSFQGAWMLDRALWRRVATTAISTLTGDAVPRLVLDGLDVCSAHLPPYAAIVHLGVMAGRRPPTIRLCILKLPLDGVAPLLAATAGIRDAGIEAAARLVSIPTRAPGRRIISILHLDIDPRQGVLPRVGLERQFAQPCQRAGRIGAGERDVIEQLTARGLCTPAKRAALLTWPGRSVAVLPHELWWSLIDRRVNHVKIVLGPGAGPEVKGYLFAICRQCRRRG